jgi:hypothetical protein
MGIYEAEYLTLYLLLVLAARNAPMTADVGLDVYLRYDHRRNLEDVRTLARLNPVGKGQRATSYMAESGPARGSP